MYGLNDEAFRKMQENTERHLEQQNRRDNPVIATQESLKAQIQDFEQQLQPDEDVGLWLVSFGPDTVFHANTIRFSKPGMVIFEGITEEDKPMKLVQHHTQLNVLFKAVKKQAGVPRRPIGFVWDD